MAASSVYKTLLPGDPFPWLGQAVTSKAHFAFDTLAGRYQLYCFFLGVIDDEARTVLELVHRRRRLFDDQHCSFIGVSITAQDKATGLRDLLPGGRIAWDLVFAGSSACGAVPIEAKAGQPTPGRRLWMLVDPSLHVLEVFAFNAAGAEAVLDAVANLPTPDRFGGVSRPAPILLLPNVFEPALRERLISAYEREGGEESGVHRHGQGVLDANFKRRKDLTIVDTSLLEATNARISRRVLPEIEKLFFMRAGFIERHIVGCYAAQDGGHFAAHRDNRQGATGHRRFAVSINLNDDFEGGEVVFPEYSMQGYKAPAGWAVVFPCAALHQVTRVTAGARYAFLPFVYDDAGAALRQEHLDRVSLSPAS